MCVCVCVDDPPPKTIFEPGPKTLTDYSRLQTNTCACVRGIRCLYQQLSIVYFCHSKGETETRIHADIRNVNKAALSYYFEYQLC